MAKAKVDAVDTTGDVVQSPDLVEVQYALGAYTTSYFGYGFRVNFVEGLALVSPDQADILRTDGLIL